MVHEHVKTGSPSVVTERQMKTTMIDHVISAGTAIIQKAMINAAADLQPLRST